jgi:VanZ family protein
MTRLAYLLEQRAAWRLLLALLLITISYLALSPAPPKTVDTGWDKLNHLSAFVALTVAASFSAKASLRHALLSAIALLAYGGLIEIVQTFLPPREGDWADLLADALGIALGMAVASLARRFTATRQTD